MLSAALSALVIGISVIFKWSQSVKPNRQLTVWASKDVTMNHIAKWDTKFNYIVIFLIKQSRKCKKISKITDILAIADTISIYRKNRYLKRRYRYDTDNIFDMLTQL